MKNFKNNLLKPIIVFYIISTFTSCEVVGGIFKAGVWSGIILVIVVVGLLIFGISKMGGKK